MQTTNSDSDSASNMKNIFLPVLIAGDDDHILHNMFSFLSNKDLALYTLVNKRFCKVVRLCMYPTLDDNRAICWASENGVLEAVRYLLEDGRVDPSVRHNYPLVMACWNGYHEIVHLLLQDKRVNLSVRGDFAFLQACKNGHVEVVRLLLQDERVDPSTRDNSAIQWAM